ncbi:MAG: ferrochelatase, partial [Methylococcales bacterium]
SLAGQSEHASTDRAKIGVLLVNLGTPDAPDVPSVRRYLAEFLADRRVIELHPFVWKPLLHGLILPLRCKRVARAYGKIWRQEESESPLRFFTRRQAQLLGEHFRQSKPDLVVDWAMRYAGPAIPETLERLIGQGCLRILLAPLYPQYSATTTATVVDKMFETLKSMRHLPALRTLPPYYDRRVFIETLAFSVKKHLEKSPVKPDVLIASYHGLPETSVEAGDPYHDHCVATTRLLREALGVGENFLRMSFQSRFGPKQWLRPYTDRTLIELAESGIKNVALFTPGFAADCLETLEEIGMQNQELFLAHGGEYYDFIPCLNDSRESIEMLAALIEQELSGWL